ncbi:MAG: hypothetical protein JWP97_2873 [Labilithrix sp.]|nr:hypothetical protein [Labilithrix sp.]
MSSPDTALVASGSSDSTTSFPARGLVTGAAGAAAVTLAHEILRQLVPGAPRMDRLGMAGLSRVLDAVGVGFVKRPRGERLRGYTLVGDLLGNGLFYAALAKPSSHPLLRGLGTGAMMGLGAVVLTPALGLPRRHRGRSLQTQMMTVALYAFGGLVAAAVAPMLRGATKAPEATRRAQGTAA